MLPSGVPKEIVLAEQRNPGSPRAARIRLALDLALGELEAYFLRSLRRGSSRSVVRLNSNQENCDVVACGLGLSVLIVFGLLAWWLVENQKRHRVSPGYQADFEFPHGEPFELYHNALSLWSMKTRVCLAELDIRYKSHHIDLIETGAY